MFCIVHVEKDDEEMGDKIDESFQESPSELLKISNPQSREAIIRGIQPKIHFEGKKELIDKLEPHIKKIFVVKDAIEAEEVKHIKFSLTSNKIEVFQSL